MSKGGIWREGLWWHRLGRDAGGAAHGLHCSPSLLCGHAVTESSGTHTWGQGKEPGAMEHGGVPTTKAGAPPCGFRNAAHLELIRGATQLFSYIAQSKTTVPSKVWGEAHLATISLDSLVCS